MNEIKDGEFLVIADGYRIDVQKVIKITDQMAFYESQWRDKPMRVRLDKVVFSGAEDTARRLAEQLKSSLSQWSADERAAQQRHRERNDHFIAVASGAKRP